MEYMSLKCSQKNQFWNIRKLSTYRVQKSMKKFEIDEHFILPLCKRGTVFSEYGIFAPKVLLFFGILIHKMTLECIKISLPQLQFKSQPKKLPY